MENIITEEKRGRGRPKGSKNKKSVSVIKTTAPSTQPVAQPIIADEYNDVIYMPMDSILEKFGLFGFVSKTNFLVPNVFFDQAEEANLFCLLYYAFVDRCIGIIIKI